MLTGCSVREGTRLKCFLESIQTSFADLMINSDMRLAIFIIVAINFSNRIYLCIDRPHIIKGRARFVFFFVHFTGFYSNPIGEISFPSLRRKPQHHTHFVRCSQNPIENSFSMDRNTESDTVFPDPDQFSNTENLFTFS